MEQQVNAAEAYLEGMSDGYHSLPSREKYYGDNNFGNRYRDGFIAGHEKREAENKLGRRRVEVLDGTRVHMSFSVRSDVHTLMFDITHLRKVAITDFIKKFINQNKELSVQEKQVCDKLVGMALGYYKVDVTELYPEIQDIYELNNELLGNVIKWGRVRELEEKDAE